MNKKNIRKQLLDIRRNLPLKQEKSLKINQHLIKFITDNFSTNSKIASFISLPNEVSTELLNNSFNVYLPIIHPFKKHAMWFAKDNNSYKKSKYKTLEPEYSTTEIIAPWDLDVVITPLVGFNSKKYRMGMGGGFYDFSFNFKKKLKNTNKHPFMIGIAFDEQLNNDIIVDKHDIILDMIITPTRTYG